MTSPRSRNLSVDDVKIDLTTQNNTGFISRSKDPIIFPHEKLPAMKVELGSPLAPSPLNPLSALPEDLYSKNFFPIRHFNFIGLVTDIKGESDAKVFSIKAIPQEGVYQGLETNRMGSEEFNIAEAVINENYEKKRTSSVSGGPLRGMSFGSEEMNKIRSTKYTVGKSSSDSANQKEPTPLPPNLEKNILKHLTASNPKAKIYQVKDTKFSQDLLQIEKKHPQDNNKHMKIAVLYSTAGQKSPQEMFKNKEASPEFWEFMDTIGEKINLLGFKGYKGDMNTSNSYETYISKWNGFEIMFHLSVMTDSEQHRRLIGNDIAVIIFQEDTPLDPTLLNQLGTVQQVFAVVQPKKVKNRPTTYRMAFLTGVNVKAYGPELPMDYYFPKDVIKNFLFTKLSHGYLKALHCPPMNRLFYVPRAASIADLCNKYSEKDTKHREELEIEERKKIKEKLSQQPNGSNSIKKVKLTVEVVGGRDLASKDLNGFSDPYCILKIKEQKFKTDVKKKTLNPNWHENFSFDLIHPTDLSWSDFELTLMDWDRFGGHDFMGSLVVPLSDVQNYIEQETWFTLQTNEANEHVSGEICLKFTLQDLVK